jgi:hypothetical protein
MRYLKLLLLLPLLLLVSCDKEEDGLIYEIYSEQDTGALVEDTIYLNEPFTIKNYTLDDVSIYLNDRELFIDRTLTEDGTYEIEIVPNVGTTFTSTVVLDTTPPSTDSWRNYVMCDPSEIDVYDSSGYTLYYDGEEIAQDELSNVRLGRQTITAIDNAENEASFRLFHVDCDPPWVTQELIIIPLIGISLLFLVVFIERKVQS